MGWISREALFIELSTVEAVNKQTQGTGKRIRTTRETARGSCQACQIMPQLSVVSFNRVGISLAARNFIVAKVIPQAIIGIKSVTVILFGLWSTIYHVLDRLLSALPDHFPTQITARLPIYDREDVDPVFLLPINVNNSSISAVLTSPGIGVSGKLAALALTHNETVRWWRPRWRPIRRKFMPSTYSFRACLRISSG